MYAIPSPSQYTAPGNPYLNVPNNVVHGKALIAANNPPVNATDPIVSGNFVVPDGVFILWVTLVRSANIAAPPLIKILLPLLVIPGESIPYFIGAANTSPETTFGAGSRQLTTAGGVALGNNEGYPTINYWGFTDGVAIALAGCIIVEW